MSYIWFWVHWLAEHTPKSSKYQFIKLAGLTVRNPREGAKIILKLLFLTSMADFNKKPKSTIQHRKWAKMTYIRFWVRWLAEHASKS